MRPYLARYTPEAAERIRKLHPEVRREIRDAIRTLLHMPLAGHMLHHELSGYRSYRVRSYRVIYAINDEERTLDVVFVGARRNVYEELRVLLHGE